jgi:YD repeat-containing protein
MRITFAAAALIISLALTATSSRAQVTLGTPPFQTFARGPIDEVNMATNNAHITIPILHKAGRGLPVDVVLTYDTEVWNGNGSWSATYAPYKWFGWYLQPIGFAAGSGGYTCLQYNGQGQVVGVAAYEKYTAYDSSGTPHPSTATGFSYWGTCGYNGQYNVDFYDSAVAEDGSGYNIVPAPMGSTGNSVVMVDKHGRQSAIAIPVYGGYFGSGTVTDTNGNQISSNGSAITDTLGTTVLTMAGSGTPTSPITLTYTDPNGNPAVWTLKFTQFTVKTNFGCAALSDYGPSAANLVTEIDLPDQGTVPSDKYTFTYEATPGYQGDVTARLSSITLPTGATIYYTYSGGNNGIYCSNYGGQTAGAVPVFTRQTPDGTWTYDHSNGSEIVTDPLGNQTVLTFPDGGAFETQRSVYQGSSTSGTLLQTVYTCLNGDTFPCWNGSGAPITQRNVYTIWPNGQESETNTNFDKETGAACGYNSGSCSYGVKQEKDEYDYGSGSPGPLLRKTITAYASLSENIYNDPANGGVSTLIPDRPSQVSVYDGTGSLKAQTTYTYDGSSLASSGVTTQHVSMTGSRGNLTEISKLVSGSSTVTANITYFDTGSVNVAYDGNNNPTTYAYSSTYAGAYPTSETNALNQATTRTYDINSGLLTSIKDPNSQTTSFAYDSMLRTVDVTYADGGQTTFSYPNPNEEDVTQKITSSLNKTASEELDSLGRPTETELTSDPDGTTYSVTSYDQLGRVGTKYNPTRCNPPSSNCGESTWGYTTYQYDSLGRPTITTEQDGSTITTDYSAFPCITMTDEAGKKRKSCSDGLDRVTDVVEDPGGLNYQTNYTYDALGNLTAVTQSGSRQRTFAYDSLSRLTSATNPESGTTTYTYDADGNVATKTSWTKRWGTPRILRDCS